MKNQNSIKMYLIGLVMMVVGLLLYYTCMIPASPLQLVAWAGLICEIAGVVILIREAVIRKKGQKKEDEEAKKW